MDRFQDFFSVALTVIHAQERDAPSDRAPLEWKLLTNLPVRSKADALEKIDWYAMRWKIETFHKILKSGCRAEDSRLRTAERLSPDGHPNSPACGHLKFPHPDRASMRR